jgi:hypothetical protein
MKSERTKMIEESKVDPNEDFMTRGIRGAMRGAALAGSRVGDFVGQGVEDLRRGVDTTVDDINMLFGTPRGKMKEDYLNKKYPYRAGAPFPGEERIAREAEATLRRESRGMKKGGKVKVSSASKRADGCAIRGKTKGRMI